MRKLDIAKKQHRERGQLAHRQKKYGLLEKHADYKKRAADFHSKEDRIKMMQRKAALRNKDEFYFGMINSSTSHGVHRQSRGNKVLANAEARELKGEDAVYLRAQEHHERQKIEKLEHEIELLESMSEEQSRKSNHIVFVDKDEDIKELKKKRKELKRKNAKHELNEEQQARIDELKEELETRKERQSVMNEQLQYVELQRNLMGKGRRVRVREGGEDRDGNPVLPVYKFIQ